MITSEEGDIEEFADLEILYEWSGEDTGANCGTLTIKEHEVNLTNLETGSREAYELAFKLRPDRKGYYILVDGDYVYKEEEENEEVE